VTLSKRKKGIYKKCQELSSLCGVEIAIICVGDYCKPSAYVATPDGPQEDLASTYRVVQRFSDAIGAQMPMKGGQPCHTAEADRELESLRSRYRAMEIELSQMRTLAQIAAPEQVAQIARMQTQPPMMALLQGAHSEAADNALEHPPDDLDESIMMRLSGRMSGINISFGGLDTMSGIQGDLRMSLDADVRRVSKEIVLDSGSEAGDMLGVCQKLGSPPTVLPSNSRTTEELLAAFVNEDL